MSTDEEQGDRVAIGIDFGNAYSSISTPVAGEAQVIANEEGDRQIPSVLSYVDGEEFHGSQAKAYLVRNADNTVAGFRDYVGKNFSQIDPTPSHASAHPQKHEDTVSFKLQDTSSEDSSEVTISEITTRHLRRLANSASDYLGKKVTSAVITVPTSFTQAQRDALVAAAEAADLEVLQLIHEPIAALLAADSKQEDHAQSADKIVVIADFGASRSDVTVVSVRGGMYSILATEHEYNLGGTALDEVVMEYVAKEFLKKNKSADDPRKSVRSAAKLRLEAESTKKALSLGSSATFHVESLASGIDFSLTINRTRYELITGKILTRFTRLIEEAVSKAELDPLDVDEVILVGGTAHTPRLASNVQGTFPESTKVIAPSLIPDAFHPNELVVKGAALQALLLEGIDQSDITENIEPVITSTPHLKKAIGIVSSQNASDSSADTTFKMVIPAETPLPVRRTVNFVNKVDSDIGVLLRIAEGDRNIKVTKPEPPVKAETNGERADDDDDDDEDDDTDDEPEEIREKEWRVSTVLGELALANAKKGSKITAQINVSIDLEVSISAMVAGQGAGVKGVVPGTNEPQAMNGNAH